MNLVRRFVTLRGAKTARLVVINRCPIILHYRTRFGAGRPAMENTDKSGPEGSRTAPEGAGRDAPETAEASGNAARSARSEAAAPRPLAPVGAGLRSAAPQAPGPSDPRWRSSADPGNRAEASAGDALGSASAGAPSSAPPEFTGAATAGTPAKLGPIFSSSPAVQAWGPPRAKAPEDRRGQAAAPSAPALPASVGADGRPAPADAGAESDPKRGPHRGVGDGAEDGKPEGAALGIQASGANPPALLPSVGRLSGRLGALAETAKDYARSAQADNTQRAYAADWRHFASWLRRQGLAETPPDPEAVGLYLASQVERRGAELSVTTLERRLSGIAWRYRQLGQPLEIRDRHIATVLAGIRRRHGRPPLQKAAIFADELLAMLATLEMDLRGLRDRAILAIGFAGGLRRSEIVGLDCGPRQTDHPWQDRLARRRNREGLARRHLPGRPPRNLAAARPHQPWSRLPRDCAQERRGFGGAADRQARRPVGEDMRPRRRPARRSGRRRTAARVRRPFPARRPRLLRPDRRGPRPEASGTRQRRNDPPLSTQARPVSDQPHKGSWAIESATQRLSGSRNWNSPRPGASRPESRSMARALVREAQRALIPAVA
jgi:integrase